MRELGVTIIITTCIICVSAISIMISKQESQEALANRELYVKCIKDVKLQKMCESLLK